MPPVKLGNKFPQPAGDRLKIVSGLALKLIGQVVRKPGCDDAIELHAGMIVFFVNDRQRTLTQSLRPRASQAAAPPRGSETFRRATDTAAVHTRSCFSARRGVAGSSAAARARKISTSSQ